MCDSNHLSRSKPTDSQMPPDNALISPKPGEHFISCASNYIRPNHPNPEGPDLDMAHSSTTPNSSSDLSKSTSGLQPHHSSSSQPSFEDVQDTSNWRDTFLKDTKAEVNLIITESTWNLEHFPPGNDVEYVPNRGSTEELGLHPSAWSTKGTGEVRRHFSARKNKGEPISDGTGKGILNERSSYTNESEGSQKDAMCIVNERTTFVESYNNKDPVAYGDKQNFRAYRSETEAGAGGNEAETRLDVLIETKRRGSETRSRLEPCAETKPGLDETCETETDFGDTEETETGFGDTGETETGFGDTGETETGFGDTGETETGFGDTGETETGFGDTGETETGFCDIEETKTGFDQRNPKQDRGSASTSSTSSSAEWKKFDASAIGTITHELLQRTLDTVTYDPQRCRVLSHDLAGQILATIIGLAPKRYKLVTFVSIGSLEDDPGVQFGSRCLWDADTDGLATVRYANETLFAVVMVYGLYRE